MSGNGEDTSFAFTFDLAADEMRRRAEVIKALGPEWDPVTQLHEENAAYELLYSGLDAEQQAFYDDLVNAGVLPRRGAGTDAA
ncbi:DUF6400 family protein [Amycolatopsis sp.]|jgi:hypothetical protein|uniref:DUF6400 family protein n=1 Tax=Amycolatopsis sp. TaxID=37632 RepID=UPI002DF98F60|nr:DUF6400 family protein [Amycolatopsis sp.]